MVRLALFVTVLANLLMWFILPFSHKMREYMVSTCVPSCRLVRNFVPAGDVADLACSVATFIRASSISG